MTICAHVSICNSKLKDGLCILAPTPHSLSHYEEVLYTSSDLCSHLKGDESMSTHRAYTYSDNVVVIPCITTQFISILQ